MPKQLLPRGGELQETERMRTTLGDDSTRHSNFFMAWHGIWERKDRMRNWSMKSIPETWASGTRSFQQSFSFTERNTGKPCS